MEVPNQSLLGLEVQVLQALNSPDIQKILTEIIKTLSQSIYENDLKALHLRGRCYFYLEQDEKALADWDMILSKDPNFVDVHHFKGLQLRYQGKKEEAAKTLQHASDLSPQVPKYSIECAYAWEDIKQNEKAIAAFERAITADPQYVKAHSGLGTLFLSMGKSQEGIELLQKAISLIKGDITKDHLSAFYNLGIAYFSNKNFDKALEVFNKGAHLDWILLSKTIQCYSALNQRAERDKAIQQLYERHAKGEIQQPRFCREQIPLPLGNIFCYEYFTFSGKFGAPKILFLWENAIPEVTLNQLPIRVSLGSYDDTNNIVHEMGGLPVTHRIWHIDAYYVNHSHRTIRMMTLPSQPSYDDIRDICIAAVQGTSDYLSSFIPGQKKEPPL